MFRNMTNSPSRAKLQRLHDVLGETATTAKRDHTETPQPFTAPKTALASGTETLGDDGSFTEAQQAQIQRDEALVRDALNLVGVAYDDLIRLDAPSPYKAALEANPKVAEEVQASANPVLAALQVAQDFAPVAHFMAEYGDNPEAIKAAMRAELDTGKTTTMASEQQPEAATYAKVATAPFSQSANAIRREKPLCEPMSRNKQSLAAIFKK